MNIISYSVARQCRTSSIVNMEKMDVDVDDVVDLSIGIGGGREAVSLSTATVRDLRALTQNAGLTITPAPPSAVSNGMCSKSISSNKFIKNVHVFVLRAVFTYPEWRRIDTAPYIDRLHKQITFI